MLFLALFAYFLLFFLLFFFPPLVTLLFFSCFNFVFALICPEGRIQWSPEHVSDLTPRQQEVFQELILAVSMRILVSTFFAVMKR